MGAKDDVDDGTKKWWGYSLYFAVHIALIIGPTIVFGAIGNAYFDRPDIGMGIGMLLGVGLSVWLEMAAMKFTLDDSGESDR